MGQNAYEDGYGVPQVCCLPRFGFMYTVALSSFMVVNLGQNLHCKVVLFRMMTMLFANIYISCHPLFGFLVYVFSIRNLISLIRWLSITVILVKPIMGV